MVSRRVDRAGTLWATQNFNPPKSVPSYSPFTPWYTMGDDMVTFVGRECPAVTPTLGACRSSGWRMKTGVKSKKPVEFDSEMRVEIVI